MFDRKESLIPLLRARNLFHSENSVLVVLLFFIHVHVLYMYTHTDVCIYIFV